MVVRIGFLLQGPLTSQQCGAIKYLTEATPQLERKQFLGRYASQLQFFPQLFFGICLQECSPAPSKSAARAYRGRPWPAEQPDRLMHAARGTVTSVRDTVNGSVVPWTASACAATRNRCTAAANRTGFNVMNLHASSAMNVPCAYISPLVKAATFSINRLANVFVHFHRGYDLHNRLYGPASRWVSSEASKFFLPSVRT
jgi:hypothetical protein